MTNKKRAIFFDRDGTLIEEVGYLSNPAGLKILPGAPFALRIANALGFLSVVVSNQAGVAYGYLTEKRVDEINALLLKKLSAHEARIDAVYYCPHNPKGTKAKYRKNCKCRKPATGMIEKARRKFNLDLAKSYIIGDKRTDVETARNAKMAGGILVLTGYGREEYKNKVEWKRKPDYVAKNVLDAVRWIARREKSE